MRIIPTTDIAIKGAHCPAGAAVEVDARTAQMLIDARQAVRAPEPPPPVVETTAAEAPSAEKAEAAPKSTRKRRLPIPAAL